MSQHSQSPRDELNEFVNRDQPDRELVIMKHTADDEGGFDGSSVEGAKHVLPGILSVLKETRMQISELDAVDMDLTGKDIGEPNARYLEPIVEFSARSADQIETAFKKNQKVLSLGGNHVRGLGLIGAMRACHEQGIPMGVVWVDAHPDLNTPDSTESGHIHGMPSAVIQGKGPKALLDLLEGAPFIDPKNIIYIGVNAIDNQMNRDGTTKEHTELKYLQALRDKGVRVYPMNTRMKKARNKGVVPDEVLENVSELNDRIKAEGGKMWTEWDVDVVDRSDMPAAVMDNVDGMSAKQIKHLFNYMGSHCDIDGVGVSEINPEKDRDAQGRSADELELGEVFEGKAQKLVAEGVGNLFGVSNTNYAEHMSRARKEMSGEEVPNTITVSLSRPSIRRRLTMAAGGIAAAVGGLIVGSQLERPSTESKAPSGAQVTSQSGAEYLQEARGRMYTFCKTDVRKQIKALDVAYETGDEYKEYVALLRVIWDAEALAPDENSHVLDYLLADLYDIMGSERGSKVFTRVIGQI